YGTAQRADLRHRQPALPALPLPAQSGRDRNLPSHDTHLYRQRTDLRLRPAADGRMELPGAADHDVSPRGHWRAGAGVRDGKLADAVSGNGCRSASAVARV